VDLSRIGFYIPKLKRQNGQHHMSEGEPLWRRVIPNAPVATGMGALPLVSVAITAYNYEQFIGPCLHSVAAQTYEA
jgi:hypothetical protein